MPSDFDTATGTRKGSSVFHTHSGTSDFFPLNWLNTRSAFSISSGSCENSGAGTGPSVLSSESDDYRWGGNAPSAGCLGGGLESGQVDGDDRRDPEDRHEAEEGQPEPLVGDVLEHQVDEGVADAREDREARVVGAVVRAVQLRGHHQADEGDGDKAENGCTARTMRGGWWLVVG